MNNVVLFDMDDETPVVQTPTAMTNNTPAPPLLSGFLQSSDALMQDDLRHELKEYGVDLHTQWSNDCRFVLVELNGDSHNKPFLWPEKETSGPIVYFGRRDHCWHAFDAGGFDFVVQSPQMIEELPVRIRHAVDSFRQFRELGDRARTSQHVAMHALGLNAELGSILHCLEHCFNCNDIVALSHETFACLREMGLSSCMTFFLHRQVNFYSDDRALRPIDQQVIMQTRGQQRIVDHGSFSLYHYDHISVLIRNMPHNNAERYGVLKDHICLLLNGVEARAAGIESQLMAEARAQRCTATAGVIQDIIVDMDAQKRQFTNRSSDLLETLLLDLRAEFSQLTLSEIEEKRLNDLVEQTGSKMAVLFKETESADKMFCELLGNLATTLRR